MPKQVHTRVEDDHNLPGTSSGRDLTSAPSAGGVAGAAATDFLSAGSRQLAAALRRRRRVARLPEIVRADAAAVSGAWLEAVDFTLDAQGRIHSWSAAAQRAYGYAAGEVVGRHFSLLYVEDGLADTERLLGAARREGFCSEVVQRLRRDGVPVTMQARLVAYARSEGALAGFAEIDLPTGQGDPDRVDVAADRLIRLAAHELRAPLGVVLGALTLLGLQMEDATVQPTPGAVAELLNLAQDELRQMDDLLGGILDSWRTRQAALAVRTQTCDLREIVEVGLRPILMLRRRVQVEAPSQPLLLHGDPVRLRQVVRNLLANAVKYSPSGSPILLRVEDFGEVLRVSVQDRGIGIDDADLERIFERHYRGRLQPDADPGGMGIGLYVCRTIVEAHGGRIWAERDQGGGARVAFEVPRVPDVMGL